MRNALLMVVWAISFVMEAIPRVLTCIGGLLMMAIGAITLLVDAARANEGRLTFFAQLGSITQHIGLAPWYAAYIYFMPIPIGGLFVVLASRMGRRPHITRR